LPVYELKEDLSARVLRRAEERVLSGSAEFDVESDGAAIGPEATASGTILRRVLQPRNLAWSGMAVVVAAVLMMVDRGLPVIGRDQGRIARDFDGSVDRIAPAVEISTTENPPTASGKAVPAIRAAEDLNLPAEAGSDTAIGPASGHQNGAAEASEEGTPEPASPTGRLLVVRCDVPAEAVGKQTLGEILAKRKIPRLEAADRATGKTYVEVELTPSQMRAVVADLKARPETFANISAPPTPGAADPRIPSAAGASRDVEAAVQATGAVPRSGNPVVKKNGPTGPSPSSRRPGSPISARLQRVEVAVDGQGRAAVSPEGPVQPDAVQPDPGAKVEDAAAPRSARPGRQESSSRSEPQIRVRFELSVVEAEGKGKESDSADKTDARESADDED
jgi:hypothetical protein